MNNDPSSLAWELTPYAFNLESFVYTEDGWVHVCWLDDEFFCPSRDWSQLEIFPPEK